jgi:hypothetical protein
MHLAPRCNNAGPLAAAIPTRPLALLLARLRRLRW